MKAQPRLLLASLGLSILCASLIACARATAAAAAENAAASSQASGAYTPPAGSAERRALMDALRADMRRTHNMELTFVVTHLKVHRGWAFVAANPRRGEDELEPFSALMRLQGGRWRVASYLYLEPDELEDPDAALRRLRSRFPAAPADIFP